MCNYKIEISCIFMKYFSSILYFSPIDSYNSRYDLFTPAPEIMQDIQNECICRQIDGMNG